MHWKCLCTGVIEDSDTEDSDGNGFGNGDGHVQGLQLAPAA